MGIFRVYLAFAVIFAHTGLPRIGLDGVTALRVFFVMSGFYMALILSRKYPTGTWSGYWLFLSNRFLRVYPVYWVVALGTLCWLVLMAPGRCAGSLGDHYVACDLIARYGALQPEAWALLAFGNLTLLGQDAALFMEVATDGQLVYSGALHKALDPAYRLLLVPQAWSLSLEVMFYLIAPMLIRLRTSGLVLLVAATMLLRIAISVVYGNSHDPWSYRFFPVELGEFVMGMIACRVYLAHEPRLGRWLLAVGALGPVLMLATYHVLPQSPLKALALVIGTAALTPFIFHLSRKAAWDRWLADLGYPIFAVHVLLIMIVSSYLPFRADAILPGILVLVASVIVAALLNVTVLQPLESWREQRASQLGRDPLSGGLAGASVLGRNGG